MLVILVGGGTARLQSKDVLAARHSCGDYKERKSKET